MEEREKSVEKVSLPARWKMSLRDGDGGVLWEHCTAEGKRSGRGDGQGHSPKVGSTSMALSASLRASGRAMSLVKAAARFE